MVEDINSGQMKEWAMKKRMSKYVLGAVGIAVLVLLVWRIAGLLGGSVATGPGSGRPPVAVELASVVYESISEVREFTGTADAQYRYIVAPKVSGRVIEITKRIGDAVRRGEVIARIDDAEYQQAVIEAEANLKIAQASLAEAQSQYALVTQELERVKSLQEKGIAASAELDMAETTFNAQKSRIELTMAQVDQRTAALTSARIRLSYTILTASEPGFIGERFSDEGALLAPNSPVVSVVGIDNIIIRTTIIERDYGLIKNGQDVEVSVDGYPGKRFAGMVSRIAPMLNEQSRVAQMEAEVVNDSLLIKPGMFSTVRVVIAEHESAQVVPSRAVIRRNGQNCVFTVVDGAKTATFNQVELGIVTPEKSEVLSPVLNGSVVVLGQHLLDDGSPVVLPGEETSNGSGSGKGSLK